MKKIQVEFTEKETLTSIHAIGVCIVAMKKSIRLENLKQKRAKQNSININEHRKLAQIRMQLMDYENTRQKLIKLLNDSTKTNKKDDKNGNTNN